MISVTKDVFIKKDTNSSGMNYSCKTDILFKHHSCFV